MIGLRCWHLRLVLRADVESLGQVDDFFLLLLGELLQVNTYLVFLILLFAMHAPIPTLSHHVSLVRRLVFRSLIRCKLRQMRLDRLIGVPGLERGISTLLRVLKTDGIDARSAEGHHERFIHRDLAALLGLLDGCDDGTLGLLPHNVHLVELSFIRFLMRLCLQLALRVPHVPALRKECRVSIVCIFINRLDHLEGILRHHIVLLVPRFLIFRLSLQQIY